MTASVPRPSPFHLLLAFGSGGLLTLMVDFNGLVGLHGSPFYSSWVAHGTGTVAALIFIALLRLGAAGEAAAKPSAPLWAYLGGVSGAVTVILTMGLFGMPVRIPRARDFLALALIAAGSAIIIFGRG